jgi:hypothetical protein
MRQYRIVRAAAGRGCAGLLGERHDLSDATGRNRRQVLLDENAPEGRTVL